MSDLHVGSLVKVKPDVAPRAGEVAVVTRISKYVGYELSLQFIRRPLGELLAYRPDEVEPLIVNGAPAHLLDSAR